MADNIFEKYKESTGAETRARSTNPFSQYAARPQPSGANSAPLVAKRPERSWAQAAGDSLLGVASGAANIIGGAIESTVATRPDNLARQGLRVLDRLGVAGMSDLAAKIPRTPSEAMLGHAAGTENAAVSAGVKAASDWIGNQQSDALQKEKQELAATDGFFGSAKKVLTSPALLGNFVAEQVPNLVTLGGGTRLAAARAGQRALAGAVAKGLGEEAASAAASAAGRKAATTAATGLTTLMETGSAGQQTYQQAMSQPQSVWDANPEYQRMIASGVAPVTAKETMARGASMQAQAITAPIAAVAGRFAAPFEADVFMRGLARRPMAMLQGAAKETVEETIQEGGSQFAGNLGQRQIDPNQAAWEGVPEAAGTGAALGAVLGGGMAAGGAIASRGDNQQPIVPRPQPPAMPPPDLPPQQLALPPSDGQAPYGVNVVTPGGTVLTPEQRGLDPRVTGAPAPPVPNPGASPGLRVGADSLNQQSPVVPRPRATVPFPDAAPGSLSEAANLTAGARRQGGEAAATATANGTSTAPADEHADGQGAPISPAAAAVPPAIAPPWVDLETGEQTRAPTANDIEQLLHANLNYQARNGGGISTQAAIKAMRDQYGLGRSVVSPALSKVKAERKRGITSPQHQEEASNAAEASAPAALAGGLEAKLREQVLATADERRAARSTPKAAMQLPPPAQSVEPPPALASAEAPSSPRGGGEGSGGEVTNTYDLTDEMLESDTGAPSGGPFTIEDAAQRTAALTEGGKVFPVDGGFVVRAPRSERELASSSPANEAKPDALAVNGEGLGGGTASAVQTATAAAPAATAPEAEAGGNGSVPVASTPAADLAGAAAEAATSPTNALPEPTDAQKEAGNYKKGHRRINGHDISIENPAGSKRSPEWPALKNHYGYIKGTVGKDKDHVDVFMTDRAEDPELPVFVVDQVNKDGTFDEHKVVMGAATEAEARSTYLDNYSKGWTGLGGIKQMTQDEFKAWVRDPKKTTRRVTRAQRAPAAPAEIAAQTPAAPQATATYTPRVRKIGGSPEYDRGDVGTLGAYFQPGRIVRGYGSQLDKVLEFQPAGGSVASWEVKVQTVDKAGNPLPGEQPRWHSTPPAPRDLADVLGKPQLKPRKVASATPAVGAQAPKDSSSRSADVAPNGIKVGDRVTVAPSGKGPQREPYEATVTEFELNAAPAYGGTAFKVAADDAKPDGRGTGWVGIDRVSLVTAAEDSAKKPAAKPAAKPKPDTVAIDDFGETLHGARKHYAAAYAERMRQAHELDLTTTPLSKSWPEPDYQKLLDSGVDPFSVAWVRAARDEIPNRPSSAWKLKGWAGKVEILRDAAARLLDGRIDAAKLQELMAQHPGVAAHLQGRMDLYQAVGHDKSLKGITLRAGEYTVYGGERYNPPRTVYTVESRSAGKSWPKTLAEGDSKEAAIEAFKIQQSVPGPAASEGKAPTRFDIISLRNSAAGAESTPRFAVAKKIGREYVELESFDNIKEARTYRAEHQQDLEKKLEQLKDIPAERRDANEPRVGVDHRAGADVTPAQFSEAFGFRGVQFGNYVEDGRRQRDLNDAYDGLLDLAGVLGVEPRALSLNGSLGLAFGARGRGGKRPAAAHFERGTVVINLTKAKGAGSLAHEWFHGLDNYFARMRGDNHGMVTDNPRAKPREDAPNIRPEMAGAFDALRRAIDASGMAERSAELDRMRSTPYWTTPPEMAARAFESYVIDKLADQGQANDYLANVVAEEAFEGMRAVATGVAGKRSYPYPSADESPALRAAFDEFFQTVESERMPDGGVRLFSLPADPVDSPAFKRWFANSQVVGRDGRPQVVYHGTAEEFSTFSKSRSGQATGHATAPLGHFFTTDLSLAQRYAENASDGVPAHERVIDAHLRVENPYEMSLDEAQSLDTPEASAAFQAYLQRQGFDGIEIPAAKTWIAFRPEQIKSATENRGTFELTNPDIRFSRGDIGPGLNFDRALQLKNELTAKWGENAPNVVVVRSAEAFPASAKADPAYRRAEGLYNGSPTVWINAGAITNEARFGQVLAHEAIGHYGVERVVGKSDWGQIVDAIDTLASTRSGSPALQAVLDSVSKRYGTVDRETFAKEAIAVMAERGIRNSFTNRVIAAVRRFLRRVMPSLQWSETDVRDLLSQADGFLRVGRTAVERQATVQAYAFSQTGTDAALSPDPQEAAGYRSEFDKIVNSMRTVVPPIPVGRTPAVLRALGAPDLPITISRDTVRKATNGVKHNVPQDVMRRLPELLADPVAVFDSKTEAGSLAVVLEAQDADGRPVLAALHMKVKEGRALEVNRVASAYGKDFGEPTFAKWAQEGLLRYVSETKNPELVRLSRLYKPGSGSPDQGSSTRKVLREADIVQQQALEGPDPGSRLFSLPASDALDDIDSIQKGLQGEGILARAKQLLADLRFNKVKDAQRPTWLGALATRHLTELGADYFKNINHYSDYLAEMQADRNQLQGEAEVVAEGARKWVSKNKAEAQQLFDLMHDATVDGVDPSKAYQPLMFKMPGQTGQFQVTKKNIKHAIAVKKQQMKERSGDSKVNMINEIKALEAMGYAEPRRQKQYVPLVERWNQLSPEAQDIYKQFRDAYRQRSDAMEEALAQRIEDLSGDGVSEAQRRKLVQRMREQFESARLQGVYFPLQRFGQHYVSAEKDDTNTFMMFQTLNELDRAVKDLKAKGWTITAQGKKGDKTSAKDAPSGTFVADVIQQLRQSHVSDKVQDEIYQLYLEALPELSMRKHSIHRKGIPGFDPDAVRAFAYNMHHGSHQLARLRYSHKLQGVLDLIQKQQDEARKEDGADVRRIVAGDTIIEELKRRHDWIMNPTDSALTNMVSSFGFVYYLGATPAAALVNLSQTALVSYPFLAARHGPVKAMNYLLAASRDAVRTMGNIQKTLTDPDELKAYQALQASGAIDKTQAHNLAGIAEGGMTGYNPAWSKAMEIIGWGFHKTEVVNREATGMAAYRLAKDGGAGFDEAVKFAQDTIFDTHFDYSNANRARFMQSGTAKVLLMFRQYSLNMSWALGRMVWHATKGQDPEVRRIARRNLAGILGMSSLFSGVLGLPMMGVVMGTLNALQAAFGDDDEPWDAETEFRAFLAEALGPSGAEVLLRGPVNKLTGANIAGRVGLDSLWIRDADRELEGRGLFNHLLEQAAGPMGGVLKNVLVGTQQVGEGHTMRGVETMLPKGLKDMIKAGRYATQGVNTLRGDPVLEDLSPWQVLLQGAGFSPAEVAERYERNRALKNYEEHITSRRQSLMNAYAMAIRNGDAADRAEVMEKVRAFNKSNPEIAISSDSIRASLKSRARYSAKAEAGIVLNPKLAARLKERVGPTTD